MIINCRLFAIAYVKPTVNLSLAFPVSSNTAKYESCLISVPSISKERRDTSQMNLKLGFLFHDSHMSKISFINSGSM